MNTKKCPECKSDNILITSNPKGKVFSVLCQNCGWDWKSEEFKTLAAEVDNTIEEFTRADLLKTKRKLI